MCAFIVYPFKAEIIVRCSDFSNFFEESDTSLSSKIKIHF